MLALRLRVGLKLLGLGVVAAPHPGTLSSSPQPVILSALDPRLAANDCYAHEDVSSRRGSPCRSRRSRPRPLSFRLFVYP